MSEPNRARDVEITLAEGSLAPGVGAVGRNALGTYVALVAALAIGLVTSLLTANALGPAGQGLLTTLRTDAAVLMAVVGLGAPAAAYYFGSLSERFTAQFIGFGLIHAALLAVVAAAAMATFGAKLAEAQGAPGDEQLFQLAAVLVPFLYLEYVYVSLLRARDRFGLANVATIAGRFAGLVVTVTLLALDDLSVFDAVLAAVAISLAPTVIAAAALFRTGVLLSRDLTCRALSFGVRAQIGFVLRRVAQRVDVIVLSTLAPLRVVGYYAIAQLVAELVLLVSRSFESVLGPTITREGRPDLAHSVLRLNGTTAVLACLAMAAVGPPFIGIAFGSEFEPATEPLLILLAGVWLLATGELVCGVLAARGSPGRASWLAALQAASALGLSLALVPSWGAEGAAAAAAISYACFGVAGLVVLRRQDDVPLRRLAFATLGEVSASWHGLVRMLRSWRGG